MFHNIGLIAVDKYLHNAFLLFIFFVAFHTTNLSAQTKPDSVTTADTTKKISSPILTVADSAKQGSSSTDTTKKVSQTEKPHSVFEMEFVKEKVEHAPDSTFFNILKISNNNGKLIQGVVKISVPEGWKIISQEETTVNIQPGASEYIPVRVSLARNVTGGVTYLINATLSSNRALFPDKNQTSVSKACYITIPQKRKWDVIPLSRTIYFNRYAEYTPLQLKLTNNGNGNEIIKIDLEMGSALEMHGSLGKRYFTSVEMKPHTDSVLSFPMKYIPPDESVFWNRDFRSLTVKISATADTLVKKTSVTYKYLESSYKNVLAEQVYPLSIEVQLQNLLSDYFPRLFLGADGKILFKNDNTFDYYLRLSSIAFFVYKDTRDFAERVLWRQAHFLAHYDAGKWEALAGDIGMPGISMIGLAGRGIGGSYKINSKHKVSGSLTTGISRSLYSGNVQHETTLPRHIGLISGLSFIVNDYNKMNTFGASIRATYPFYPGHRISVLLSGTQTHHLYDNQTFTYPNGNFITTTNPGATFYGLGTQADYTMNLKKVKASMSANYISKHYSQYFNGRLWVHGSGQYIINKKYYVTSGVNFNQQEPQIYNRGVLNPENKFTYGRYNAEFSDRVNSRVVLSTGPVFEHSEHRALKIKSNGDSIRTRFSAISPKWLFRLHLKNSNYSSLSVFSTMGYTYITHAEDSTLGPLPFNLKQPFFNTNTGVNILQKNWGVNISYFTGPYNIAMQSDYYFGNFNKSLRIMPYFQRYYFNRRLLVTSYNSYYYQTRRDMESIALNARFSFFFDKGWTLFIDNNMFMNSRISNEGIRTYGKMYGLNLGFRKSFDIPQPAVKYYDLRVICFKDINGNGIMDANEHGLSDIVITIDRQSKIDSITKKQLKLLGHFAPAEMVTDNFGQVMYYHIPQGDFNLNVFPLINFKDLFNIKGQKQNLSIASDTTYYIPFVQSYRVFGHVILKRDEFSSAGNISLANIRVTATDSSGNSFPALSSGDGAYTLYVPQAGEYKLTVNNIFGEQFTLQDGAYTVSFNGAKEFQVDFIFVEKKRQLNVGGKPATVDSLLNRKPADFIVSGKDTIKNVKMIADTIKPNNKPYLIPTGSGITYRIQLVSTSSRIPKSQFAVKFKGISNVKEYSENGIYKYAVGDVKTVEEAKKLKEKIRAKGYKDAFLIPFYKGKRMQY